VVVLLDAGGCVVDGDVAADAATVAPTATPPKPATAARPTATVTTRRRFGRAARAASGPGGPWYTPVASLVSVPSLVPVPSLVSVPSTSRMTGPP
jgi:hypothetical protein